MTDVPRIGAHEDVVPHEGDDYVMWDAPYVLGALGRAERLRYEAHLDQCPSCRAAVAELAGLPGLLGQVDSAVALALVDPADPVAQSFAAHPDSPHDVPDMLPRMVSRTRRERRRESWQAVGGALAAAAAAVVIAVPVTHVLSGNNHPSPPSAEQIVTERQLDPVVPSPITASFRLVQVPGGTRVEMSCSYAPSVTDYTWQGALWVVHTDGTESMVARWTAHPGQTLTPDGTTAAPPDRISAVQIRAANTNQIMLSSTL